MKDGALVRPDSQLAIAPYDPIHCKFSTEPCRGGRHRVMFRPRANMIRIPLLGLSLFGVTLLALSPTAATAADCPGNPAALNTERVLTIDPAQTAPVGRKQFPRTLPLAPKEIV